LRGRPLRIESFAAAVLERMDGANIARADVFGYSMGGYVALHLAATSPARIRRVATLATKLVWTAEIAARECVTIEECVAALRHLPHGELEVIPRTPHPFEKVPIERVAYSLSEFFGA
jgi:pimeloyl-ACP methyl ester carboxylesterase